MFKQKSNKIFPEKVCDTNDPIQARIYENYLNLRKKMVKPTKRKIIDDSTIQQKTTKKKYNKNPNN